MRDDEDVLHQVFAICLGRTERGHPPRNMLEPFIVDPRERKVGRTLGSDGYISARSPVGSELC